MYFIIPLLGRKENCTCRTFLIPAPTVPLFLTPGARPDRATVAGACGPGATVKKEPNDRLDSYCRWTTGLGRHQLPSRLCV